MRLPITEVEINQLINEFAAYIKQQQNSFLPQGAALSPLHRQVLAGYFSTSLLEDVRIVQLQGQRIPKPEISLSDRISPHVEMPDIAHMNSFTFLNVLVFQDPVTERRLFHAMVHAAQFARLGLQTYLDLYIRAFLETGKYHSVPLEIQAFRMDARFSESSLDHFNVEGEIEQWSQQDLYRIPGNATPPAAG